MKIYQYPTFFRLVYGLPYEPKIIADVLFRSRDNCLDKLCLQRLNNLRGTEYENYIAWVLFYRAIGSSFFEKKLSCRMKHSSNQLTIWRVLINQMVNLQNTPEIIRMKIILAGFIAKSRNMDNFIPLCSLLTEFAPETKDIAINAIKHFNQIAPWSADNISKIISLMKRGVLGTKEFRETICKILLPSFANQICSYPRYRTAIETKPSSA